MSGDIGVRRFLLLPVSVYAFQSTLCLFSYILQRFNILKLKTAILELIDLSIIATHPSHQRKGLSSLLMTEFCKQVDDTGLPAYLESSPSGKALYERFGFVTKDSFSIDIDGEPYVDCCMLREGVVKDV